MHKNKLPGLIILMVFTLVTVVFWILFNIYRSFSATLSIDIPEKIILQITPKLDRETIETMKSKINP